MSRARRAPHAVATCLLGGLASALLAGCATFEPTYHRPAAPIPAAFPQGGAYPTAGTASPSPDAMGWQAFFTDAKLRAVISQALANNRDLRVAVINIQAARQQYRAQNASLFPALGGSANATYEHTPLGTAAIAGAGAAGAGGVPAGAGGAGAGGAGAGGAGSVAAAGSGAFVRLYAASLGVSAYELDLWGRERSLSKQAFEQYLATVEARRASQISLVAEVATDYLTLAADTQRLTVARQTLQSDQASYDLAVARFRGGVASELDVRQAQTPLEIARSDVATYASQGAQDVNALDLLVGTTLPGALLPAGQDDSPPTLTDLPTDLPSAVLLGRPDVLQAEHQLRAYNANIGAARAAFFPTVSLTGSAGATSFRLSSLFGAGSGTWLFSPGVTLPIFDAGRNQANLRYATAQRDVAVAQYERAIQTGFRDVADALAERGTVGDLLSAQQSLVDAASGALVLSQARYQRGADTYLATLTAQLNLYTAQRSLIAARLLRSTNLVNLYRALGGGLEAPPSL